MIRAGVFTMLVASAALAADDKKELEAVAGSWVVEKAEMGGQDITATMKHFVLTLKDDTYDLDDRGKHDKGTVKADGSKSPKWLDITGGDGSPHKGKTIPCIYELKDGKLTVCYGLDYKTRPAAFKTEKGSKAFLATYKKKDAGK